MTRDELLELAGEIERDGGRNTSGTLNRRFYAAMGREPVDGRHPVQNLQDALEEKPEGWAYRISSPGSTYTEAGVSAFPLGCVHQYATIERPWSEDPLSKTAPAAALCAAILRAKAAEMESE